MKKRTKRKKKIQLKIESSISLQFTDDNCFSAAGCAGTTTSRLIELLLTFMIDIFDVTEISSCDFVEQAMRDASGEFSDLGRHQCETSIASSTC